MTHRLWLPFALLALVTGPAQAQIAPGWGGYGPSAGPARVAPAMRAGAEAAEAVKAGMDKLTAYLSQKDAPNKLQAAAFLDREIAPYFDFAYMAQWIAGPGWAGMSEEERKAMAANIEASFLTSLAAQMAKYDGQQVRYLRPLPGPGGTVKVPVGILRPGAYPARMTFRTYRSADGWKVYDVEANGRSVAAYYRTQMRQSAQQAPAKAPAAAPGR
jgi:phospholipid transport system substrate-binding protein